MPDHTIKNDSVALSLPPETAAMSTSKTTRSWNTNSLGLRVGADAASAAISSVLVAPIICVIDRYVYKP
jgi:hypothetical protein